MDQAQNFGGAASSVGSSFGSGDLGDDFREGLEGIERECEVVQFRVLSANATNRRVIVFSLAQESARSTKAWYESSDKK